MSMNKIKEIMRMKWQLGHTHREIARSVNAGASSISRCLQQAIACGLSWESVQSMDEAQIHSILYSCSKPKNTERGNINWAWVRQELTKKGVTLQLLWHEYKQQDPQGLSYNRYCYQYRQWCNQLDVTLRQTYKAGEKVLVDYSGLTFPIQVNSDTGEIKQAEIFVGVMGASNRIYVEGQCQSRA